MALTEVHGAEPFIVRPHVAAVRLAEVLDFDVTEVAAVHRLRIEDLLDRHSNSPNGFGLEGVRLTIEAPACLRICPSSGARPP